jgi:methyl-accepting chemotaxis protein
MNAITHIRIAKKLIGAFVIVALIGLGIGMFGYSRVLVLDRESEKMHTRIAVPLGQLARMSVDFQRARINLRDAVDADTASEREARYGDLNQLRGDISALSDEFEKTLISDEAKALFAEFKSARKVYGGEIDRIMELDRKGRHEEASAVLHGEAKEAALHEQELLNKLMASKLAQADLTSDEVAATASRAGVIMIGVAVLGTLLSVALGWYIAISISRPVEDLARDAKRVSDGDLTVTINSDRGDEIGELARSFKEMTESLRGTISQVAHSADQLSSSSEQLHVAADQIATGAEEMLAQTQSVATAGEEMAATAQEIAASCQRAADSARQAAEAATQGVTVVDATVTVMNRIAERVKGSATSVVHLGDRSNQIGDIVGTIENIASQTNLLALNAAIEAARAGDMGRGFAVVADEVRTLAARTTKATQEISDMIRAIQNETKTAVGSMEESVKEVELGTNEASRSGNALRSIFDQINNVNAQITQVATAAEEQTAVTSEISRNIHEVTGVVDQTARNAQESADAAARLSENAIGLRATVQRFRV